MGLRQQRAARKLRDWLFLQLGRRCRQCGSTENLEFDCVLQTGDSKHHREMSWDQRMRFYVRQHRIGNLQVLCDKCHGKKTAKEDYQPHLRINEQVSSQGNPF